MAIHKPRMYGPMNQGMMYGGIPKFSPPTPPQNPTPKAPPKAPNKVGTVMHEFKAGGLHSGSKQGPVVTNPKQAIAIALNQARKKAL